MRRLVPRFGLRSRQRWWGCSVLLALALALVAFLPAAAQTPVVIEMGEQGSVYYFEPKAMTVPPGTVPITFKNVGARRHNWVVKLPSGEVRTPDVNAGQTLEQTFTFTQPGTFDVLCDLPTHAQRGMVMTLTVAAPGSGAQTQAQVPAPAPPPVPPPGQNQVPVPPPVPPPAQATVQGQVTQPPAVPVAPSGAQVLPSVTRSGSASATLNRAQAAPPAQTGTSGAGWPLFVSLAIHIPSAIAWLGIVLFDAFVVAVPFLTPVQRAGLLQRPKWLVLATIPLFLTTGVYQTIYNPFSTIGSYADLATLRYTTTYGEALFWKHGFVVASMVLTLGLTFWFAPRLAALAARSPAAAGDVAASRMPPLLAWANVVACIALLTCVAIMVYQLH